MQQHATVFRKWKRLFKVTPPSLKVVTYTVNVVVWYTRCYYTPVTGSIMAYRFVPSPVTLGDLEGHSPVTGLNKCNSTNICATFRTVQLTRRVARSLGGSWASCRVRDRNGWPPEWRTQIVTFCVCGLQIICRKYVLACSNYLNTRLLL